MQFKIMIFLAILTFVGTVVGGAFFYYKDSQATIAALNQQTATLTQAVDQQKEAIEAMEQSIRDQAAIREDMMKEVESARKDVEKLQTKIASHDFKLIASEKAGLLEKKINRATNDVMRCFEIATGDAILPDEKNNQCSDLLARP
jgi:septal ring factor EnvC (AmiA/AmiB activator)